MIAFFLAGGFYYEGGYLWALFVAAVGVIAGRELWNILKLGGPSVSPLVFVFGAVVVFAALVLIEMRRTGHGSVGLMMCVLGVICSDSAAYFGGRFLGGPKIAPDISPNKTWSGSVTGLLAGILAIILVGYKSGVPIDHSIPLGFLVILCGQAGDLFESFLKREAGLDDSGWVLPGHGGVLDRIDGLIFALIGFVICLTWSGG
jgi:phosphatidate cytidylyltransferase